MSTSVIVFVHINKIEGALAGPSSEVCPSVSDLFILLKIYFIGKPIVSSISRFIIGPRDSGIGSRWWVGRL